MDKCQSLYFVAEFINTSFMEENKLAIAEKLLQADAIRLSPAAPYTWASGWKSPIYCDNRAVLGQPAIRDAIKSEMCSILFESFEDAALLAGVATAGIAWGAMAADQLKLPYVYVRPKPKEHGMGNQIEGRFEPGAKTVVIEDLISTGGSSLKAVQALQQAGLEVVGLVAIFTYGFPQSVAAFESAGIPLFTLTDYPSLISLAAKRGLVQPDQLDLLDNWRQSPETWGK